MADLSSSAARLPFTHFTVKFVRNSAFFDQTNACVDGAELL
jgi:hypothetical protein